MRRDRLETRLTSSRADDVMNGIIFADEKPAEVKKREEEPTALKKRRKEGITSLVGELMTTTARETRVKTEPAEDAEMAVDAPDDVREQDRRRPKREEDSTTDEGLRSMGRPEVERKPSLLHRPRTSAFDAPALSADAKTTLSFPPTGNALDANGLPSISDPPPRTTTPPTQPLAADRNDQSAAYADSLNAQAGGSALAAVDLPRPDGKFFDGLRFCHVIDEECDGLEKALQFHGGVLLTDEERLNGAEVDYVVVRL